MRYGLPYMGSKNKIAKWVLEQLPAATNFYDLFCGGCAITHAAILSRKYKTYTINDINENVPKLFCDAIAGKYKNEERWISRDDFMQLRDNDEYVRLSWSFGNSGRDYMYSKKTEPTKKALHYAIFYNDFTLADALGVNLHPIENIKGRSLRYEKVKKLFKAQTNADRCDLESLERLKRLERLESLERLQSLESLERFAGSYADVEIKPDSVIYCDIPYRNTHAYNKGTEKDTSGFDYEAFYDWCERQTTPVFISEYWMPEDRFKCVAALTRSTGMNLKTKTKFQEKIFIPKGQEHKIGLFDW